MNRRRWDLESALLGRCMPVACWGDWGKPLLLFPTATADCLDYERFGMLDVLAPLIGAGRIKVYSCTSVNSDLWLDHSRPPRLRTPLATRYDRYLVEELLPFIRQDCGGCRPFAASGASFGAYNAVAAAARHPEWFDIAIGLSGVYDLDRYMGSHRDLDYYYSQPLQFVPNLSEGPALDALRRTAFVIATGTGRWEDPDQAERLANVLKAKGIPTFHEVWGPQWDHDWPTWRVMLPLFLDRLL